MKPPPGVGRKETMRNTASLSPWLLPARIAATLALAAPLHAEKPPVEAAAEILGFDQPRAHLLVLGTFHFAYPGLDVHQSSQKLDMLSLARQAEIGAVLDRLAEYQPTKIAVEFPPEEQPNLDERFRAYLAGTSPLTADEVQQLGFRLAARLGHTRLYAADAQPSAIFQPVFDAVEAREKELAGVDARWQARYERLYAFDDALAARQTLVDHLRYMNDPARVSMGHGSYSVGWFKLEGADGDLGADFRAAWYDRNLRIFRNLQSITTGPQERLLLIIGAGHLPILRFLAVTSPEYEWVEAGAYLTPARGLRVPELPSSSAR